jgi:hypothetical protein
LIVVLANYAERNHQGKANRCCFLGQLHRSVIGEEFRCQERLGGLLKYYHREAA